MGCSPQVIQYCITLVYGMYTLNLVCSLLQETEIKSLENAIAELKSGSITLSEDDVSPELEKLISENNKLKYQIVHLKRVRKFTWCLLIEQIR
jgi:hypothetical protein